MELVLGETGMTAYSLIKVIHIFSAILMAWPFYALLIVNQRIQLGPPLGDRVDVYMETIIKNRAVPCFVFQATVLVSGLLMLLLSGQGLTPLFDNPAVGLKFVLLLLISAQLSHVHFRLQPQIDLAFEQWRAAASFETVGQIERFRLRRKRLASFCMLFVLTNSMLGVQVWRPFPWWMNAGLMATITLFTWRAYKGVPTYGWF